MNNEPKKPMPPAVVKALTPVPQPRRKDGKSDMRRVVPAAKRTF